MGWIKPTGLSGIQDVFDEGGQNRGIAIRLNGTNLESIVRETSSVATTLSSAFPNDGDWHHIALVFDGGNTSHKLYLDGVEVASSSSASASIISHFSYGGIGGKLSGNDSFKNSSDAYFTGKMDAFAVYDSVKTLGEIETAAGLSALGTTNVEEDFGLVYPNPFNNQINISLKRVSNNISIGLYDVLGKEIMSKKFLNTNFISLPVEALSNGLYLLKMKFDNEVFVKKILKQ